MNEKLPGFVVLPDHRGFASNGPKNWDSAFLPGQHAGAVIYPGQETPINDLFPDKRADFISSRSEAASHQLLTRLNREHAATRHSDDRLEARIRRYGLAAPMQLAEHEAMDLSKEPDSLLDLYGINPT